MDPVVLVEMGRRGESAYGHVDGQETCDIPTQAIKGRVGTLGKHFSGCFNLRTGRMRLDCVEEPAFWLEVDLSKVSNEIPVEACKGRAGTAGKHFGGSLCTGRMRLDCMEEPAFWLEMDLSKVPAFSAAPGGAIAAAAASEFEARSRQLQSL